MRTALAASMNCRGLFRDLGFRFWGFPKTAGTFLGPHNKGHQTIMLWGIYWGRLVLGNDHSESVVAPMYSRLDYGDCRVSDRHQHLEFRPVHHAIMHSPP